MPYNQSLVVDTAKDRQGLEQLKAPYGSTDVIRPVASWQELVTAGAPAAQLPATLGE